MWRLAVVLLVVPGCSLYFPSPGGADDGPVPDARIGVPDARSPPPDAYVPPDAHVPPDAYVPPGAAMARCEDGELRVVATADTWPEAPGHGAGRSIGRCAGACRSAAALCSDPACTNAAQALCEAPISVGATCPLDDATCQGTESIDCPETTACSVALPGSTCTCTNGSYRCSQLTAAAAVQAGIVGKWRGMVTTPGFTPPYPITLWIYPDGTYWPDCALDHCSAFYYGGDGPSPRRKITILSTAASVGASADIAIDFGYSPAPVGALSALVVDATNLRFTFSAAWSSCGQPFDVSLTRYQGSL